MDWINAHRKVLLAALTAILVIFVDSETADYVTGVVGVILTWLVPNDPVAEAALYDPGSILPRRRRG